MPNEESTVEPLDERKIPSMNLRDIPKEVYDKIIDKIATECKKKKRTITKPQAVYMIIRESK